MLLLFSWKKIPEPPGRRNRLYLLTFIPSYYEQTTLVVSKQDPSARSLHSEPTKPKDFLHLKRSELSIKYHNILKNIHRTSLLSSLVKVWAGTQLSCWESSLLDAMALRAHTWVSPHRELRSNSAASSTARECQGWNVAWSTLRHCWHSLGDEEPFPVSAQDEPRVSVMGRNHPMPSASSLAKLSAWQGSPPVAHPFVCLQGMQPWQAAVGNSCVCPDALASHFTFADGPHARGQVYLTEAVFCSAQAVSKILPREQINRTMFEPLVHFNVIFREIYVS